MPGMVIFSRLLTTQWHSALGRLASALTNVQRPCDPLSALERLRCIAGALSHVLQVYEKTRWWARQDSNL